MIFSHNRQSRSEHARFGHVFQAFFAQSLERVRGFARFENTAAQGIGAGFFDSLGCFQDLLNGIPPSKGPAITGISSPADRETTQRETPNPVRVKFA